MSLLINKKKKYKKLYALKEIFIFNLKKKKDF